MHPILNVFFVCVLFKCVFCELPETVQKCSFGDKKCIITTVNNILQNGAVAYSNIPLPILDPLDTKTIKLEQATTNLGLNLIMRNSQVNGLSNAKILKVKGFGENPSGTHELMTNIPRLQLEGDYTADGRILVLPFEGNGRANITAINAALKLTIKGEAITKNNEQYLDVTSTTLQVKCERIYFDLTNLFNNQKELSDTLLNVINENWKLIFDDLNAPMFDEINKMVYQAVKAVFAATPYRNLFKS